MMRRHPALCVVAGGYFLALAVLCLTPNTVVARGISGLRRVAPWASASGTEVVVGVILFVPVGLLLVLISGRRRWVAVLVIGALACFWLRLAEMVWLPVQRLTAGSVMPHLAGFALGVAIAVAALAMRGRTAARDSRASVPVIAQRP
ncbi:hypothetical protein BH11ACT2_BH11ACT2_12690 [soil metagenome]